MLLKKSSKWTVAALQCYLHKNMGAKPVSISNQVGNKVITCTFCLCSVFWAEIEPGALGIQDKYSASEQHSGNTWSVPLIGDCLVFKIKAILARVTA